MRWQTEKAFASLLRVRECSDLQSRVTSPTAPACRIHRADTPDMLRAESESWHTAKPRLVGRRPVSAVATEVFGLQHGVSARGVPGSKPHETSPQTTPSSRADAAPAPMPRWR